MIRKIIHIDREKCNGCGACAAACHEGAIGMVDGKAYLLRDDYCDGLGDCLPACPTKAITFVEREALAYDEAAVARSKQNAQRPAGGCPGSRIRLMKQKEQSGETAGHIASRLRQWPVQIKLVPIKAPWLDKADLLIAADCTAYAYGDFHRDYMHGRVTLIGCPKLDSVDYSEKLTELLRENDIRSITVVRMEVPCCGGIQHAVERAILSSGKQIPCQIVTLSVDGQVLQN